MSLYHLSVILHNSATFHCCSAEYFVIHRLCKEVPGNMELETTLTSVRTHCQYILDISDLARSSCITNQPTFNFEEQTPH